MKAKELVGKVVVRTEPALFVRGSEIRTTRPEILKIDDRFTDEIVKILEVTEHNILISVSNDMSHPFGFDREIKVVLPSYFLDKNWQPAELFEKYFDNSGRIRRVGEIDANQEISKMALEDEVNSAFADVMSGPEVNVNKIKDFVGLIFPGGEMEIDVKDKSNNEIAMEMISKLKGLEAEKAKEVLDIIVDVAEEIMGQQERINN